MSPDPFFQPDLEQICRTDFECQKICSGTEHPGFYGARIHPDCLRITEDGLVRVGLSVPASTWFSTPTQWGDVLQVVRNKVAALAQFGPLPELLDWSNAVLPRDATSSFTPNLAEYATLWAVREQSPVGVVYGLEACDASGNAFHRIYLTASGQREGFEQFVTCHQSSPMEMGHWFSPNHSASIQRCRALENRIAVLYSHSRNDVETACLLPREIIPRLLTAAGEARLPIRTTHYQRALIRAVLWVPDMMDSVPGEKNGIELLHGDGVGLRVNLASVTGVWLWRGQCSGCGKRHWTIEVADADDQVGLAFTAGDEQLEANWRELLKGCVPEGSFEF